MAFKAAAVAAVVEGGASPRWFLICPLACLMVLWDEKVRNAAGRRFPSWDNGRMVNPITLMISEGVGVEAGVGWGGR